MVAQALFSYIERKVNILKEEKIIYKNIDDLIPYENNPRLNDQGVDALAESIKEFGFKVPIIIDSDGVIVAGHTRLKACKKLGIEEVPCIVADDLTDEQLKAFRLADNKVAELSDWDLDKLKEEIEELDIDMTKYGFVQIENLDQAIEDINDLMEKETDDEVEPKAKRGDIYKLGEHYLMCGDSTEPKDVEKLTQGNKIDLVVTDPPYFIDYDKSALGEKIANDDLSKDERVGFLVKAFTNFKKALKDGGVFYIWHADMCREYFTEALKNAGLESRQVLIWVKNPPTLSRQDYNWKHEPCLYGWKDGASHYYNNDFTATTINTEHKPLNQMSEKEKDDYIKELESYISDGTTTMLYDKPLKSEYHPTTKPVKLIAEQISRSSKIGESVMDLFGGSGTTLLACEELNRKCYMMEYEPKYVDIIIQRWEEMTGYEAVKVN